MSYLFKWDRSQFLKLNDCFDCQGMLYGFGRLGVQCWITTMFRTEAMDGLAI